MLELLIGSLRCAARLRLRGVSARRVTCEGRPPIVHGRGRVELGRVALRCRAVSCEIGATGGGVLRIDDDVFINQGATIVASTSISIGSGTRIGDYVAVYDTSYHAVEEGIPVERAPVTIGRNVWLARGVVVLPGAQIGDGSVVAVNSVVRGTIPPRVLAAGSPARVVRNLTMGERWVRG